MDRFGHLELGKTGEVVPIDTVDHHRDAAVRMAQQVRTSLSIVSRLLDPPVYDTPEFAETLTQTILRNRHLKVRVLVWDPLAVVQRGHRLLELAGKLSSFIELRKPGIEHRDFNGSILLADDCGYLVRQSAERYEGSLNFNDRALSKSLLDAFEEMWAKGTPDPNLRRMIM